MTQHESSLFWLKSQLLLFTNSVLALALYFYFSLSQQQGRCKPLIFGGIFQPVQQVGFPGDWERTCLPMQETWDRGLIPGLERSPGRGHGNPLQYSCLENLMERRAWRASVHRVAKSRKWLKQFSMHTRPRCVILRFSALDSVPNGHKIPKPCYWSWHLDTTFQLCSGVSGASLRVCTLE